MIDALTELEKRLNQKEQARHSALLRELRAELADSRRQKYRGKRR